MKRLWLIVVVSLSISLVVHAQDADDDPGPIYVDTSVNRFQPEGFEFPEGQSPFTPELHIAIVARIAGAGYQPIMLSPNIDTYPRMFIHESGPDVYTPSSSTVSLRVDSFGDLDSIAVTPFSNYEFNPMPRAVTGWTTLIYVRDEATLDLAAQATAGIALYTARDCEAAMPMLNDALDTFTTIDADEDVTTGFLTMLGLNFYRGSCLYVLGDLEGAIAAYETALTDPDANNDPTATLNPIAYTDFTQLNLAFLYTEQGENARAVELLDSMSDYGLDVMTYDTLAVERNVHRAELYLAAGEADSGLAEMDLIIGLVQEAGDALAGFVLAQALSERARFKAQLGMDDEALTDFEAAITADADYPLTYYWRGVFYAERGENDLAIQDLNTFLILSDSIPQNFWRDISRDIDDARARLDTLG